jgi:hypothetical protein
MMVKYFSEKVAPGVHDAAAKKEGFGVWKEEFIHRRNARAHELAQKEHAVHKKTRGDMMVK